MLLNSIFTVLPMFVCLMWTILLLSSKKQNAAKRYLAFFLTITTLNYFTHAAYFNKEYALFAFMDNIWVFTSLAGYPLFYYYIRLLTTDEKTDFKWLWILLPSFGLSVFSFAIYFSMSPEELNIFIHEVMYRKRTATGSYPQTVQLQILRMTLFKVIFAVQLILVFYFGYKHIINYNNEVKKFYSNIGGRDLSAVKWLLTAFLFASAISLISNFIGKDYFINDAELLIIPSLAHTLFLFFIGYVGYHQDFTIVDFNIDKDGSKTKGEDTGQKAAGAKVTRKYLVKLLTDNELYKNPDLKITDIAHLASSNRTYISHILNEELNMNFCNWINSYRIAYAKEIMENPEYNHTAISEISEMSGFSSKSVFYRVFKETYGISPGKFYETKKRQNMN